jgi:hypothetical protein
MQDGHGRTPLSSLKNVAANNGVLLLVPTAQFLKKNIDTISDELVDVAWKHFSADAPPSSAVKRPKRVAKSPAKTPPKN